MNIQISDDWINNRRVELYERKLSIFGKKTWDWRRISINNGQTVCTSGNQGYWDKSYAMQRATEENPGLLVVEAE
jgi:hypothetical protein